MFKGHEFIKLDKDGKWVLDYTEYNIYKVVVNKLGTPIKNEKAASIDISGSNMERFVDMPVYIIRKALATIKKRQEEKSSNECN